MSTILNVLANANGPLVVDAKEFDAAISRGIAEAQAVHKINDAKREDAGWRDELSDLQRRLQGLPSVEDAEGRLAKLEAEVASQAKAYENEAAECRKALATPYLSNAEATHLKAKVTAIEEHATAYKAGMRVRLAQSKALVGYAKTWNPCRERYAELKARAAKIDQALK